MRKNFYDDISFDYPEYWEGRRYEHLAEEIAIKKMLKKAKLSSQADLLEIGAGFGRLCPVYEGGFKSCILLDPSEKLINEAKKRIKNCRNIKFQLGVAEKLPFKDNQFDLVLMVRVAHHLEEQEKVFKEVARVLKPKGFFIFEFANKNHFKARLFSIFDQSFKKRIANPKPVDIRSKQSLVNKTVPFLNYQPKWILKLLKQHGFSLKLRFSVSNFRSPIFKKILPLNVLLLIEKVTQPILGKIDFGPSIFLLLEKSS